MMLIQSLQKGTRGLAIVFAPSLPEAMRPMLAEWAVLVTDSSPHTTTELQILRRYANGDADTPLLLIGVDDRCHVIRRILHSNIPGNYAGVFLLNAPPVKEEWERSTWERWESALPIIRTDNPERLSELVKGRESLTDETEPV